MTKENTLLVFLHGWKGKINSWDLNMPYFEKLGYRCVAIEMPGFDLPESKTPMGVPEYSGFIVSALEGMLCQNSKVVLIGHSFGGRLGIYIASLYPEIVDRLILSDSAGLNLEPKGLRSTFRFLSVTFSQLEKLVRPLSKLRGMAVKLMGSSNYKDASPMMREVLKKVVDLDLRYNLSSIKCKTLIVWGELDEITPIELGDKLKEKIKNSHLEVIKQAKHHSHKTHAKEWNRITENFLREA